MVPSAGFEPTTYSLRVNCSSNWAKKAVKRAGAAPASWPYKDQALLLCKRFIIISVIPISQQDSNLRALRTYVWLVRRFPYRLLRSHSLTIWPCSGMRYGITGSLPIGRNRTSSFTPHGAIGRNLPPKGFEPSCNTPYGMPFTPMNYGRHSGPTKALSFDMVPEVGFEPTYAVAYGAFGTLPYEGSACLPIASHRLNSASMPCLERAIPRDATLMALRRFANTGIAGRLPLLEAVRPLPSCLRLRAANGPWACSSPYWGGNDPRPLRRDEARTPKGNGCEDGSRTRFLGA